eukprot:16019227-Heterocapsa_arctica.AAC.1
MKQEADRESSQSSQWLASDGARTPLLPDEDEEVNLFFGLIKEQADATDAARPTAIKTQTH